MRVLVIVNSVKMRRSFEALGRRGELSEDLQPLGMGGFGVPSVVRMLSLFTDELSARVAIMFPCAWCLRLLLVEVVEDGEISLIEIYPLVASPLSVLAGISSLSPSFPGLSSIMMVVSFVIPFSFVAVSLSAIGRVKVLSL